MREEQVKPPEPEVPPGRLSSVSGTIGADPEFFFTSRGRIIASEKVLPEDGLNFTGGKVVRDGIQGEITFSNGQSCRQSLAKYLTRAYQAIAFHVGQLNQKHPGANLDVSLEPIVDIEDEEWDTLQESSKQLGCQPSENLYEPDFHVQAPPDFRMRSAGGHVHLGCGHIEKNDIPLLIKAFDSLIGNLSVLLDRSSRGAERRVMYGKAGEYRLQPHGIEYRTLTNFWTREYKLFSLIFGLTKAISQMYWIHKNPEVGEIRRGPVTYDALTLNWVRGPVTHRIPDLLTLLPDYFDSSRVVAAINQNDPDLAWENWQGMKRFIQDHWKDQESPSKDHIVPLWPSCLESFETWLKEPGVAPVSEGWGKWGYLGVASPGWEAFIWQRQQAIAKKTAMSAVQDLLRSEG